MFEPTFDVELSAITRKEFGPESRNGRNRCDIANDGDEESHDLTQPREHDRRSVLAVEKGTVNVKSRLID